jgi:hypothetical protein
VLYYEAAKIMALTRPTPISAVDPSSETMTLLKFPLKTICTPVALEKPGLEAWPPDLTAKGVLFLAIICS